MINPVFALLIVVYIVSWAPVLLGTTLTTMLGDN